MPRSPGKTPNRRWWQRLLRAAAALAALAVVLYAALPWLLPKPWLARRIAASLSEQLHLPVTVDKVTVDWGAGLCIEALEIGNPPGFGPGPLLRAESVRCDFSPVRMLLTGRLEWVEVQSPRLSVELDGRRRLNLSQLPAHAGGVQADRLSVRQAVATLSLPDDPDRLRLDVSDLQVHAGRLIRIGRVSMSASLAQPTESAPVSLTVLTGKAAGHAAALLRFNFAGVDVGGLGLANLLDLPLARLEGSCSGQLQCWVDAEGYVRDFNVDLAGRGLDVQPRAGPPLPVIDQAFLRAEASLNVVDQLVDVHAMSLQLPGVSLHGQTNLHVSALAGQWMGLRGLSLAGQINPAAVGAMLRGEASPLAGWLDVDGQVGLNLVYTQTEAALVATLGLDAAGATVHGGSRLLKPEGSPLACNLNLTCKPKTWQIDGTTELLLGGNRYVSHGALTNIRTIVGRWIASDRPYTLAELRRDVAELDWGGEWEITELDSLRRLHPALEAALAEVSLEGRMTGHWKALQGAGTMLGLDLICREGSRLQAGRWLDKPTDCPLELHLLARYAGADQDLQDAAVQLVCGRGQMSMAMDRLEVGVGSPGRPLRLDAGGTFRADAIEQVAACLPGLPLERLGWSGSASGKFYAQLGDEAVRAYAECDAAQMRLRVGEALDKAPGQPCEATVNALWDRAVGRGEADLRARLPGATFVGRLSGQADAWRADGRLEADDVAWLMRQSPLLLRQTRGLRIERVLEADLHASLEDGAMRVRASLVGDSLELRADGARRKGRGTPLALSVDAMVGRGDDGEGLVIEIHSASATADRCAASASGRASLDARGELAALELVGRFALSVTPGLLDLAPELAEPVRRHQVSGGLLGRYRLIGGPAGLNIVGDVDADALAWVAESPVIKPPGLPGRLRFEITASAGQPQIIVNDLRVTLGAVELLGGASFALQRDPPSDALSVAMGRTHLRLWTDRAEELAAIVPALADWALRGDVELAGEAIADEQGPRVLYAEARLSDLSALYRGRRATLNGAVLLEGLSLDRRRPALARVQADNLHVQAGPSDAHLFFDLHDLTGAARGELTVLAEAIDCGDLRQWLAPALPYALDEYGRPPALDDRRADELRTQADAAIAALAAFAAGADLSCSAHVRHVRNFPDSKVHQIYDVDHVALEAKLRQGTASLQYVAGLFGGTISDRYEVDLRDGPTARVRYLNEAIELQAHEKLQPQVEAFFPGNEVRGEMSRQMDVTLGLRDMVMNAIDDRWPVVQVGTAHTVFREGITRGRAAPNYVTAVFPGLNLVEYHYDRMESFSRYLPDGSAQNDMIFSGKTYDMYVEGATDAQQVGRYQIGIILLGSPQSADWNHRFKQGRIPILNWRARIVGGQKVDETVSYPWPNQTVFTIFLKNNIFYRLWLDSRSGRSARPSN